MSQKLISPPCRNGRPPFGQWPACRIFTAPISTLRRTACSDLVDMIENPTDWPAFASELTSFLFLRSRFSLFSISRIRRATNTRADSLAKEARCSGVLFSHIDQTRSDRASLQNASTPTTT
ncbi:hypothetical protein N665_0582s0005 [Sinapis alba]|nr:hypothetical protein N665_0582s0005 [Sinapis alba]